MVHMTPLAYQHLQMELEGILLRNRVQLVRAHPTVDEFPLCLNVHTSDGQHALYWDAGLPENIAAELAAQSPASVDIAGLRALLTRWGRSAKAERYVTYTAPSDRLTAGTGIAVSLHGDDPRVAAFGFDGMADEVYACLVDDVVVAACVSVRRNRRAAEAWVRTAPSFRRKGMARQVVTAWMRSALKRGQVPFYSHSADNIPSAQLARSLGLFHLFDLFVLEETRPDLGSARG